MDQLHSYILAILCFLPLLFIVWSDAWKGADLVSKMVMGGLLVWATACCFTRHMCIQFYCGFAVIAFIYSIKKRYFKVPGAWIYLFFAYFIWHALSLIWVSDITAGLLQLRVYSLFIFIPLTFCCFKLSKDENHTVMTGFFRAMSLFIAATLVTWAYWIITNNANPLEWLHIQKRYFANFMLPSYAIIYSWSNYVHPTYNSIPILVGLAIGFYKASKKAGWNSIHYIETILYSALSLLVIILSQSRIGLIGWCVVVILGIIYILRENKIMLTASMAAIALLCLLTILFGKEKLSGFVNDPIRKQNLTTAQYCIEKHPILGSGIEGIRAEMDSDEIAQALGYPSANKGLANPHNQFIGDLMQTGIVGVCLSLAIFLTLSTVAAKRRNYMLLTTMVIMLLIANIEMPFYLHKGVVLFLLFTGWFTSSCDTTQKEQ